MASWRAAKRVLVWVAGTALIAYLAWYLLDRREQFSQALDLTPLTVGGVAGLVLLTMALRAAQFRIMLSLVGARVSLRRAAVLVLAGQFVNCLPIRAGTVLQAALLKREESLKYALFASVLTGRVMLTLLVAGIFGGAGLLLFRPSLGPTSSVLFVFFAAAAVGPLILLAIPKRLVEARRTRLQKALHDLLAGWERLRSGGWQLAAIMAMTLCRLLAMTGRLWLCFGSFRADVGFAHCLALAAVVQVSFLTNITPGGLGQRQVLVSAAAAACGLSYREAMFASSLDHGLAIMVTLVVGLPSLMLLLYGRRDRLKDAASRESA